MRSVNQVGYGYQRMLKLIPVSALMLFVASIAACDIDSDETRLPAKWVIDYKQKSIGQIVEQIGAPQELATAKQYINWVDFTPKGRRVLKLVCRVDCNASEMPTEITFLVYRTGGISPVRAQKLL